MDFGTLELHFYGQCGMLLCAVKCADFPNSYIKLKMKALQILSADSGLSERHHYE